MDPVPSEEEETNELAYRIRRLGQSAQNRMRNFLEFLEFEQGTDPSPDAKKGKLHNEIGDLFEQLPVDKQDQVTNLMRKWARSDDRQDSKQHSET